MKVRIVGTGARQCQYQFQMSYVVNDTLAIDAGCIGYMEDLNSQRKLKHVFLSHSHIDHTASIAVFVDNVYEAGPDCVTIYGSEATLRSLRQDVFNDRVWPDIARLSREQSPFARFVTLRPGNPVPLPTMDVLPIELDHLVPTLGFIIREREGAAVAIVSDTGPTEAIWQEANRVENLSAVFLEATFPDALEWLAEKSKHLCPRLFQQEVAKLNGHARLVAIHLKPSFYRETAQELLALGLRSLEIGVPDREYDF